MIELLQQGKNVIFLSGKQTVQHSPSIWGPTLEHWYEAERGSQWQEMTETPILQIQYLLTTILSLFS